MCDKERNVFDHNIRAGTVRKPLLRKSAIFVGREVYAGSSLRIFLRSFVNPQHGHEASARAGRFTDSAANPLCLFMQPPQ